MPEFLSSWNYVFLYRLALAGVLGAAIGFERECRAKEAGTRTHFLVAVGSCLMMIVSQWGFQDVTKMGVELGQNGFVRYDVARVAAQIVSGIGFIGAGTIMMQKQVVHGLTTAAGLWAVAGIGMAIGGGLYVIGIASTFFVLAGLEILQMVFRRARFLHYTLVYSTAEHDAINRLDNALKRGGWHSIAHEIGMSKQDDGTTYHVTLTLQKHDAFGNDDDLLVFVRDFPDVTLEKISFPR